MNDYITGSNFEKNLQKESLSSWEEPLKWSEVKEPETEE